MKPRNLSLVKFNEESVHPDIRKSYPFQPGEALLFVGEIVNMPEHCILIRVDVGETVIGYHTENFVELSEEEL